MAMNSCCEGCGVCCNLPPCRCCFGGTGECCLACCGICGPLAVCGMCCCGFCCNDGRDHHASVRIPDGESSYRKVISPFLANSYDNVLLRKQMEKTIPCCGFCMCSNGGYVTCCPGGKCWEDGGYTFGCIDPEAEDKLHEPATRATDTPPTSDAATPVAIGGGVVAPESADKPPGAPYTPSSAI